MFEAFCFAFSFFFTHSKIKGDEDEEYKKFLRKCRKEEEEEESTLKTLKSTIFHFNTDILRFCRNKTFLPTNLMKKV
jgi:hypothetical protein